MEGWFGLVLILIVGGGFAAGNLFLSQFLGPSKPSVEKSAPYECGMPAVGDARERMSVKFYLVAMVFLLFDIEVAFLYPWALAIRDLRWVGLDPDRRLLRAAAHGLRLHLAQGRARLEPPRRVERGDPGSD